MQGDPHHLVGIAEQRLKHSSMHDTTRLRVLLGHRLLRQRLEEKPTVLENIQLHQTSMAELYRSHRRAEPTEPGYFPSTAPSSHKNLEEEEDALTNHTELYDPDEDLTLQRWPSRVARHWSKT